MSYGDEIMAAGHAQKVSKEVGGKVAILGKTGNVRWHDLWRGNPHIATPDEERAGKAVSTIRNGPECRPYIQYPFTLKDGHKFTDWRARDHRGSIYIDLEERILADEYRKVFGRFIVVEPNIAKNSNPNKSWGFENWCRLISIMPQYNFIQVGPAGTTRVLPHKNVIRIFTKTFRRACIVLSGAELLISIEGGLHHAAAALRMRAVVIFGGCVDPGVTGYPEHRNMWSIPDSPCGQWATCKHCIESMETINPVHVKRTLEDEYYKPKTNGVLWQH